VSIFNVNAVIKKAQQEMIKEMLHLSDTIDVLLPRPSGKLIQFIGSQEGEGTTTLVRAFAKVVASRPNEAVLLIDTAEKSQLSLDLVAQHLKDDLEQLALQGATIDKSPDTMHESCLFTSPVSTHGTPLPTVFRSLYTNGLLDNLRQRFTLILVDSPPVTSAAAGLAITRYMDGVVLVVEAAATPWPVIKSDKDKITNAGGNVLGVVFNKQRCYIPPFIRNFI
jgi:protein-tyrosine kinase